MKNNELIKTWKNIDPVIPSKSEKELNQLLDKKIRKTINKYVFTIVLSTTSCIGVIAFIIIATLDRQGDLIYQTNNFVLGLVTIILFFSILLSWHRLIKNKYDMPLKKWLETRIDLLSKWLTGKNNKLSLFLIPVFYILLLLSIHVYFENKLFTDVFKTEDSVVGLIIAIPVGLFVSYFVARKIRKYHLHILEHLRELYSFFKN